ncbi:hypothetical protein KCP70_04570 [Salmonella enterica subsp. enterica]|nr:hypothetical protein KCP70_04570 [Salmonella enterica subsp. enterica]
MRVAYITLSLFLSQAFIFAFLTGLLNELLTRRPVCRCSVSVVAHYRELLESLTRPKVKAQPFTFQTTFEPKAYFRAGFKQKQAHQGPFYSNL